MNNLIILIIVAIIMGSALVGTLFVTKERDAVYSSKKSMNNLGLIYIALIPVLVIVGLFFWL
ncbi:hypothetical protein [Paenisporosarcina indica]|uniref:hypothetical protein n=1 Tax=Paenisporosarcina indica TaxID=650093 RepID=UPI000950319F|nr:hypothetical protein [Paenisporosarcina indica]